MWDRVAAAAQATLKHNKVGAYPCSIADIPRFFEEVGFENISVDFIAVTSAADSAHYDMSLREKFIKSNRQVALDAIVLAENYAPRVWSDAEIQQLRGLVEQKFAKRLNDLRTGKKVWDISVEMMMIAHGYKPLSSLRDYEGEKLCNI
ncbi:hypothetical protein SpAn4DRAFT_1015 [Sporomusa ovata]|uniref:Uncharacterized protein n=1 Tax=Sporomusa ovata TaxID=2378 RepID=A0A0U1L5X7_9FIRM|nr:hypothetical protein SpAn4DRAFT_1015 [Sporomusa ovata]